MELVVKIVNSIRGKALKRRLFRELMDEVDCYFGDLLLHSNVCWLINVKYYIVLKNYYHKLKFFYKKLILFMKN